MGDQEIRAALDRHWTASDADDFETEHDIYVDDAVLEYPQSGERIRGRRNIQITLTCQPSKKRFAVRRVIGSGDLWITERMVGPQTMMFEGWQRLRAEYAKQFGIES